MFIYQKECNLIDDSVDDSNGNTYAVPGIDISARDSTEYMYGKGFLILITGLISMILAVGAIFWFGPKRGDDEKDSCR